MAKTAIKITLSAIHGGWETIHSITYEDVLTDCEEISAVPYLTDTNAIEQAAKGLVEKLHCIICEDDAEANAFAAAVYGGIIRKAIKEKVERDTAKTLEQLNEKVRDLNAAQAENAKLKCMLEGARGVADDVYEATHGRPGNPLGIKGEPL